MMPHFIHEPDDDFRGTCLQGAVIWFPIGVLAWGLILVSGWLVLAGPTHMHAAADVGSRFIAGEPLSPAESWIVLGVTFVLVLAVGAGFCFVLDRFEVSRQRSIAAKEQALEAHHVAQLLLLMRPVSEDSSRALHTAMRGRACLYFRESRSPDGDGPGKVLDSPQGLRASHVDGSSPRKASALAGSEPADSLSQLFPRILRAQPSRRVH